MGRAFTTYNTGLANQLSNEVVIHYEDRSVRVRAVWDTGATNSCISTEAAKALSLVESGKVRISTPSGNAERNTYLVDIELPNNVRIKDLVVSDSEIGGQAIGMLVGMDVIGAGDFSVSNFNGKTVFTFRMPSEKTTDYVAEIRCAQLIGPPHGKGLRKKRK